MVKLLKMIFLGKAADTEEGFKEEIKQYWFTFYDRDSPRDSSGFEHTFLGEKDTGDNSVGGFHNWIQLYFQDKEDSIVYIEELGYCEVCII